MEFFFQNSLVVGKLNLFPVMQNDASMYSGSLTLQPPDYSIWIFTHLKLCLADAIHNFKWVKIIQI